MDGRNLCFWFHDELPFRYRFLPSSESNTRLTPYNHHVVGANWSVDEYQNWFGM